MNAYVHSKPEFSRLLCSDLVPHVLLDVFWAFALRNVSLLTLGPVQLLLSGVEVIVALI